MKNEDLVHNDHIQRESSILHFQLWQTTEIPEWLQPIHDRLKKSRNAYLRALNGISQGMYIENDVYREILELIEDRLINGYTCKVTDTKVPELHPGKIYGLPSKKSL